MKRLKWTLVLLVVAALAIWVGSRWSVWFHNVEEEPYTPAATPHRVLLTFGDADGLHSRNVSWQCDTIVRPSELQLVCLSDSDTVRVEAQGEVFRSRSGQAAYYVARLRNLKPDERYAYRAVTDGKASPWYDFHTYEHPTPNTHHPSPNTQHPTPNTHHPTPITHHPSPITHHPTPITYLYVGDVQDTLGGQANRYLREALARHPETEFLVCGGDLTERPTDQHWAETFRDIDSVAQHLPLLCVTGNHDYLKGVIMRLERRFPLVLSYFLDSKVDDNMVYTMSYGPAQFFLLDSNREFLYLKAQRDWLERELKASTAHWKIVVLHHPLFSIKGNNNLIQRWFFNDLIEQYGVDLVMQGHEHAYARMTRHDDEGRPTTPVYTVSHCSPKNYRIEFSDRFDKFGISSRYYQTVTIAPDTLTLSTYEVYNHTLYDSLLIVRSAPRGRLLPTGRKKAPRPQIIDPGRNIPEYLEFTPDPNSKKDQKYAARIADYKQRHPERLAK